MAKDSASLLHVLAQLPAGFVRSPIPNRVVSGIAIDSRRVQPGDLFVALRGTSADGHAFIADALAKGAAAIVGDLPATGFTYPYVQVRSTREALSWIAAAYYGMPARRLTVIGITGTDGKTTTANLIHHILGAAGKKVGLISTVNAIIGNEALDTGFHVTTPDAHDVQRYLAAMVERGLTHVVLETTSHGWAQHRVDACEFDIGVLTNITHEHLDEHGSYENYRAAKARLFTSLSIMSKKATAPRRLAVLNRDDSSFEFLSELVEVEQVSYGTSESSSVRAYRIQESSEGIRFLAEGSGLRVAIDSPLLGSYNVSNCLAALCATVLGLSVDPILAASAIGSFGGVPGRMERIEMGQDFAAYVDFAHTPHALEVTLHAARKLAEASGRNGRIIAVFGSAGLRDQAKRRMMARISVSLADLTVLTAEDPRTESLDGILEAMAEAADEAGGIEGSSYWRIADRGAAIRFAVQQARSGDIVLACGKGHEQSMCFGSTEYLWDDRVALRAALAERMRMPGPQMPYLPTQDHSEEEWLHSTLRDQ